MYRDDTASSLAASHPRDALAPFGNDMVPTRSTLQVLLLIAVATMLANREAKACTGIYTHSGQSVLVGNNEDGANPETRVWFVPSQGRTYGRMYVGYNDLSAQGGVNEKGLWFDGFGLPYQSVATGNGEIYAGDLQDKLMAECATVDDVLAMLHRYSRAPMTRYQWMFGDATGKSVIIEADTIIPISGRYQIITNFRQSSYPDSKGYECNRYRIARSMLEARSDIDLGEMRRILAATHSEGEDVTLYSYIADLKQGIVYLYHFHDFENVVVFDIRKELAKGGHVYTLPELFQENHAEQSFAWRARTALASLKSSRKDTTFDASTYPSYCGRFVVVSPDILARQTITVTPGTDQIFIQLNDGGKLEVLPDSHATFFLVNYGGWDFTIRFGRDVSGMVDTLHMDGGGLHIVASIAR